MGNAVLSGLRSMKKIQQQETCLLGGWWGLLAFFFKKKQPTTFHCATWMQFALHSIIGQLTAKAKPEIPFPIGASRLSPHKPIQTDVNTDNSAI